MAYILLPVLHHKDFVERSKASVAYIIAVLYNQDSVACNKASVAHIIARLSLCYMSKIS